MKRLLVVFAGVSALAFAVVWAVGQLQQASVPQLPGLMPEGALLYLEAKDFNALLHDWNSSDEKRAWLAGDSYQAFSRSRLFERLSQAQNEFSAAAGLTTDSGFLGGVAGGQSCLAVYDIGKLEFVYVTRMDQATVESTPLWQLRTSFEPRTEGTAQFFVRNDQQSSRTAAFAMNSGWLILATREDLIAGVLARLQTPGARSMTGEGWFADAVKQAPGPQGELRMVLNLDKLVRSPYFRSYWVQQNASEMKQYRTALSDLYRTAANDREERLLLRRPEAQPGSTIDVASLAALAPPDAEFFSAQASPSHDAQLQTLRDNLLEVKPKQSETLDLIAPPAPTPTNAGDNSMLDVRIDQAPVVVARADPYQPLGAALGAAQPVSMMQVFVTQPSSSGDFLRIDSAMVIEAENNWDETRLREAITIALQPGLTAGRIGVGWDPRSGASGNSFGLTGRLPLFVAVRDKQLFLANNADLLDRMLARRQNAAQVASSGVTYTAVFHHSSREQENFRSLFTQIDHGGSATTGDGQAMTLAGQGPPFFSGNITSLSRMFQAVNEETMEEEDQGEKVFQTVVYQWNR